MEKNIPTAEQVMKSHYNMDKDEDGNQVYYGWIVEDAMIEFAKMHVEAALKEASEKFDHYSNKNAILGSYSLDNIK